MPCLIEHSRLTSYDQPEFGVTCGLRAMKPMRRKGKHSGIAYFYRKTAVMRANPFLLSTVFLFSCTVEHKPFLHVAPIQTEIVFSNVGVIPMDRDTVLENQVVVAKNGMIVAMGPAGSVSFGNDALRIDATGKYLMPGLAEMHAHVPPVDDLAPMEEVLALFALNGVTTIRGMLGHPKHLELQAEIRSGRITGPRFYTAGPPLDGDNVKTPAEAVAAVRAQKQAGYDFIKILMPGLSRECFDAMAATAKEVNMPFAGHVPPQVGVRGAIDAGYATIDHMDGFIESMVPGIEKMPADETGLFGMFVAGKADTSRIPALVQALRDHHTGVVPTQSLAERWFAPARSAASLAAEPEMKYVKPKELKNWSATKNEIMSDPRYDSLTLVRFTQIRRKIICECNKAGVLLLLGSDAPQVFNVPGFSLHHELQYLVEAGLTPYEALRTGTVNVARFYKRDDAGVVRKGAVSDLILLNANPLEDISNSRSIEGVLLGDRWLSKNFIEQTLNALRKE